MTSILTNSSAMLALQTLKMTNKGLDQVQSELSTGKKISSAKDNAATWSIATVMDSDIGSFKAISDSLNLGQATIAVARSSSEQITELLTQMKEKIVSAQEENVDRTKIQADIDALKNQVDSIVNAAQFNGLNLLDDSTSGDPVSVLSSLNRSSDGTVTASHIDVAVHNLTTTAGAVYSAGEATLTDSAGATTTGAVLSSTITAGNGGSIDFTAMGLSGTTAGGEVIKLSLGSTTVQYTTKAGDSEASVASALKTAFENTSLGQLTIDTDADGVNDQSEFTFSVGTDPKILEFTNNGSTDYVASFEAFDEGEGGLSVLSSLDVTTDAEGALTAIETAITNAVDAAASFGSSQGRLEVQEEFVSKFIDAMSTGVGALVDADMEESAARLQALQVQQQLGLQALSIANSAPQNILSLFR